ncbi:MAG: bis(5'-nucleosyl)-tetraphosphatase [Candidatus Woesearchaeota archaeon]
METEKSCGAIIFRKEDDNILFLLVRYVNEPDYWGLVKGHVEDDETEVDTAIREIREETGIEEFSFLDCFRETERYSPKEGIVKDVVFFLAETEDSEVTLEREELDDFAWLKLEDALKRLKFRSNKEILKRAYDRIEEVYNRR